MDKEKSRKERKKIKAIVEGAFNNFHKNELFEEQFIKYLRDQGMSKEEADDLWVKAYALNMIEIERRPLISKERYPRILGHVTIFVMVSKES